MKNKILKILSFTVLCGLPIFAANAESDFDTENPIFLESSGDFLSRSGLYLNDSVIRVSQMFSYGVNGRLALNANIKYQQDFNGTDDGFSHIGVGGIYRISGNSESEAISDALFGVNFGGSDRVRTPDFANTAYYAGMRFGRQWSSFTLAGTIKTTWIFDEVSGMAYIDLMPEAYVKISPSWMTGLGFDLRKSTNPVFDQEWINFKLVRKYGRTEYVAHVDYEFESSEYQFGANLNILF
ncbi:MAG TPA: hypothetical protein PKJ33_00840 [Alphaproteobacteria bacterium]|nr:hypothetical protein [Alphaproteobacteria bacterium]